MARSVRLAAIAIATMFTILGMLAVERANAQVPATPVAEAAETGAVTISVVDQNGAPFANADVSLLHGQDAPLVARTGPSGIIGFDTLAPGTYSVQVSASGHGTVDLAPVEVVADEITALTATLLPLAEITVAVTNEAGDPVNGATISLIRNNDPAIVGTTGAGGNFVFTGLHAGTYTGSVTATGYGVAEIASFALANGDEIRIDVTMPPPPPGAIQFTVTDAQGKPIPTAGIELYDDNDNQFSDGSGVDSAGVALFGGLKASSYLAIINAEGYEQGFIDNISVNHGQTRHIHVTLQKSPPPTTGSITVNILYNGRISLTSISVSLYGKTMGSQQTQQEGIAVFSDVQPGVYAIKADGQELGNRTVGPLTIVAGQSLHQVIDLAEAPQGNNGTVIVYTDTEQPYPNPLGNVQVTITRYDNGYTQTLKSDGQGTLIFTDVPPGYYIAQALALDANNEPYDGPGTNFHLDGGGVVVKTFYIRGSPAPGTASLAVTVTDQQGQPISGADVSVESALGPDVFQADSSGVALATNLPPGDLTVRASAAGYEVSDPVDVTVAVDTRDSLTIRLTAVQAPIPEPTSESPNGLTVVQLPSTGVGGGAPGSSVAIALMLMLVAGLALAASVRLKRR
jgi:hypothetical protein